MATLSFIFGVLSGLLGGFIVMFLVPFSALTGFRKAGVLYLVVGVGLLVLAYALGLGPALLLSLLTVNLLALFIYYRLSLPYTHLLPRDERVSVNGITTIEDAVQACQESKLLGWELVAYAQKLTATKFTYSRRNPRDSPSKAFERGRGYCQQQALALKEIYDGLGIVARPVYANRCQFPPPAEADSSLALVRGNRWLSAWFGAREHSFGHTWLRVRVGGEELDVCPGDPTNRPGSVHFEPLSEVKNLHLWLQPLTHLGSAMANLMLEKQVRWSRMHEA
jgi:hypothetical protein